MPNVASVLNEQIRRLARREIKANTKTVKKATSHYRRDIAALKRQIAQLTKSVKGLEKQAPSQPQLPTAEVAGARLRVDGLKAHRARLDLSAKDYGKLLGVSSLTVYNWEAGKSKPRRSLLPRIVAVRGIGKREAMERLGLAEPKATVTAGVAAKKPGKRGVFKQTGEELILGLLKGRKSLTSRKINMAWMKAGRGSEYRVG